MISFRMFWVASFTICFSMTNQSVPFVVVQRGTLPIIFTVPHGGFQAIPYAAIRKKGRLKSDVRTLEFAQLVNEKLIALTGEKPYLVMATFHRKYLDVNRVEKNSIDGDGDTSIVKGIYQEYHQVIKDLIAELKISYKQVLLIDIHGQSTHPATIFRGTSNLKTVSQLIEVFGVESISGNQSILGFLEKNGYVVHPIDNQMEDKRYSGGYTVRTYGSHQADGVNAIQLEFGTHLRLEKQEQCAADLAKAIMIFVEKYLRN